MWMVLGLVAAAAVPAPGPEANAACRPQGVPTVAVLDVKVAGLKPDTGNLLSEALRSAFVETRCYRVQDTAEMRDIIRQQALNLSAPCADSSCEVQVGRLLQVRYIITSQAYRSEGKTLAFARLTDVELGTSLAVADVAVDGESPDALVPAMNRLAGQISGVQPRARGPVAYLALGGAALSGGVAGALAYGVMSASRDMNNASDAAGFNTAKGRANSYALGATVSWLAAGAFAAGGVALLLFTSL